MQTPATRRLLKWVGWAVLVLALPVALMGALMPANQYQTALGVDALDCDGPMSVYLFALPALLVYGAGLVINALAWRKRVNMLVALVCAILCGVVAVNLTRTVVLDRQQAAECRAKSG